MDLDTEYFVPSISFSKCIPSPLSLGSFNSVTVKTPKSFWCYVKGRVLESVALINELLTSFLALDNMWSHKLESQFDVVIKVLTSRVGFKFILSHGS